MTMWWLLTAPWVLVGALTLILVGGAALVRRFLPRRPRGDES